MRYVGLIGIQVKAAGAVSDRAGGSREPERRLCMTRRDYIIGNVIDVLDEETISLMVDRTGGGKRYGYKTTGREKIQINRLRLTDIAWLTGTFTVSQVEKMLKGKQVLCLVRSRDPRGSLIADVQLI